MYDQSMPSPPPKTKPQPPKPLQPPPPPQLHHPDQPPLPLYKQHTWSPDMYRDEAWRRRTGNNKNKDKNINKRRSRSVTDEDLDDLKASIELGFGFESPQDDGAIDRRLSDTLPALELYYAVNKNYYDCVSRTTPSSSAAASECGSPSSLGSPRHAIFGPGDTPQTVKTRLRQWAQVVACSVRQFSNTSTS